MELNGIIEFFKTNKVFFLSTIDGSQPRVRPFGVILDIGGKIAFCTRNTKEVFRQLEHNNNAEICSTATNGDFIRVYGKVSFQNSEENKKRIFEVAPFLKNVYADKENELVVCVFDNADAYIQSTIGKKEEVKIY